MVNHISSQVYNQHVKGARESGQNATVLYFMMNMSEPITIRMLQQKLNSTGCRIDLVSLRRSVHNLTMGKNCAAMLKVAYEAPCPVSRKTVGWYAVRDEYRFKQGELFNQISL